LALDPDPATIAAQLAASLDTAWRRTAAGYPANTDLRIETRGGRGGIVVTPLDAEDEPASLVALRGEVERKRARSRTRQAGASGRLMAMVTVGRVAVRLRSTGISRQCVIRGRGSGHVVGNEPQPRQRAQLHRGAQHLARAAELSQERHVGCSEREEPDQIRTARFGEPPQLRQLILGEHVPGRHRRPLPLKSKTQMGNT